MRFVLPSMEYEQKAIDFIREFYEHSSDINGTGGLGSFLEKSSYSDWLKKITQDLDIANIPPDRVPAFTYFYVREKDDEIIGMISIRLALTDFLRKEGGHIGYCIRPLERKKGHAAAMLREALVFCAKIGLHDVIITCDKDNLASARVIQKCGGILNAEFRSDVFKTVIQRYIITMN